MATEFRFGPYGTIRPGSYQEYKVDPSTVITPKTGVAEQKNFMTSLSLGGDKQFGWAGGVLPPGMTALKASELTSIGGLYGLPAKEPGTYRVICQLTATTIDNEVARAHKYPDENIVSGPTNRSSSQYFFEVHVKKQNSLVGIFGNDGEWVDNIGFIVSMGSAFKNNVTVDLVNGTVVLDPKTPITLRLDDSVHWTFTGAASDCTMYSFGIYHDSALTQFIGGWFAETPAVPEPIMVPPEHYAIGHTQDFKQLCLFNTQTSFPLGTNQQSHYYTITIKDASGATHTSDPELINKSSGGNW